jgi:hypothetical protein
MDNYLAMIRSSASGFVKASSIKWIKQHTNVQMYKGTFVVIIASIEVLAKLGRNKMDLPLCGSTAMSHNEFTISEPIEP